MTKFNAKSTGSSTEFRDMVLDPEQRHLEPKKGAFGSSRMIVKEGGVDKERRSIRFQASTKNIDRYNEVVEPKAFEKRMPLFKANPVACAGHVYIGLSGEPTVIGHWEDLEITEDGLEGTLVFASTALANEYWVLYSEGHMKAVSVGWLTHAWEMRQYAGADGKQQLLRTFTDVELIEISCVAIPANREALMKAAGFRCGQDSAPPGGQRTLSNEERDVLATMIRDTIREELNTDPGSPLSIAIQETIRAILGSSGHSHGLHEEDEESPAPVEDSKGNEELAAAVKDVAAAWKQ